MAARHSEIEHGVTVIATGASEWKPDIYGYGTDPRIRTHLDMSEAMRAKDPAVMKAGTYRVHPVRGFTVRGTALVQQGLLQSHRKGRHRS